MTYQELKPSIYKWREANREVYNATMRRGAKKYYETHKDKKNIDALKRYYLKKELEVFRNILAE